MFDRPQVCIETRGMASTPTSSGLYGCGSTEINEDGDAILILKRYVNELAADERVLGSATLLSKFGRRFARSGNNPDWLRGGAAKQCFANATAYAMVRNDVVYAEGYALDPAFPVPIEHAWLVDRDGNVIDPTWKGSRGYVYFGIVFKQSFLAEALEICDEEPGILINMHRLREGFSFVSAIFGSPALENPVIDQAKLGSRGSLHLSSPTKHKRMTTADQHSHRF